MLASLVALLLTALVAGPASASTTDGQSLAIIEPTLLVSTLDGNLYAIGQKSGLIKWTLQDDPIVRLPQLPNTTENLKEPLFLPDPKDGSLYIYNGLGTKRKDSDNPQEEKDALQKMPFTISELVSASPCKSSDGRLYTGRKVDSWITIDGKSGAKIDVLNSDSPICPNKPDEAQNDSNHKLLLLGKSEYHLSIFDLKTRKKQWNVTLIDYSASATTAIPQSSYEMLHLTSSSSGRIVTVDLNEDNYNKLLWSLQLGSPIVAIYLYNEGQSSTRRVPFTTVGDPIANSITEKLDNLGHWSPSVYIGESESTKSAYALSTNVEEGHRLIGSKQVISIPMPLLEGPSPNLGKSTVDEYFRFIIFGYYETPAYSGAAFSSQLTLNQRQLNLLSGSNSKPISPEIIPDLNRSNQGLFTDDVGNNSIRDMLPLIITISIGLFSGGVLGFWVLRSKPKQTSPEPSQDGVVRIGKISFDPKLIIGRGSAGTCVYEGNYEGRQKIAVKRIITDYFILADREIELLRSLEHPNLVRYFATESDSLFKYIGIELAELNLADYIDNLDKKAEIEAPLSEIEIIYDSCLGLAHLHSLNVIHRDIKPHNILISAPIAPHGKRKVLITDFGVSKVMSQENTKTAEFVSTTRVIRGTEGWIAPEVLKQKLGKEKEPNFRTAQPIDMFSMGCLFYYVLTRGKHPFGDSVERQANILRNEYSLAALTEKEEHIGQASLIESLINEKPLERPSINTVLKHPIFWDEARQLQFFQDISDRIEKEAHDSEIVSSLERGGFDVVKGDWRRYLTMELQTDLRKFRSYKGSSVRDLLRALRNKRHHYRELTEEVQASLGSIPDEFVRYFTSRFPRLLYHSYIAMQQYKFEPIFKCYYDQDASWEFTWNHLPRTGIRWFEFNQSPVKIAKQNAPTADADQENASAPAVEPEIEISLKPNGFANSDMNWRQGSGLSRSLSPAKNAPFGGSPKMRPSFRKSTSPDKS